MKFCDVPFKFVYFDYFDGRVMLCPWMRNPEGCPGNILKDDLITIWENKQSQKIRKTITDGSFKFCRLDACPHLQNGDLPEIDAVALAQKALPAAYPTHFNLAYDFTCNQFCETCRPQKFRLTKSYTRIMEFMHARIAPFLDNAEYFSASGHGDPFASPFMMKMLSGMHPKNEKTQILLETNGVYFDEAHWKKIAHLGDFNLRTIVTINSFDEWTYKHISRGGNYSRLMHNLDFIKRLREKGFVKHLALTLVIQDRNFREIPSFIERCLNTYNCDQVLLRPVYQWGTMPEDVYWFKDVLNPCHPYHTEYLEIRDNPLLKNKKVYNFAGNTVHPMRKFHEISKKRWI